MTIQSYFDNEDIALRYSKLTPAEKARITRMVNKMAKDNPNEDIEAYRQMVIRVHTRTVDELIDLITA